MPIPARQHVLGTHGKDTRNPNHRRVNTRDSARMGRHSARASTGSWRVPAASWDFLGNRGDPASHTRFSVICRICFNTCAMLRGSIAVFCACSHRLTRAHDRSARDFPLRPINSHAITRSRRRATRGDKDPEGDSRLHTGTRFRNIALRRASSTSPRWRGQQGAIPETTGPRDGNEGGGSGSGSSPIRPFLFGQPERARQ